MKRPALTARVLEARDMGDFVEMVYEHGWTDGLPVFPPTDDAVVAMIEYLGRDPDEVVGIVPPGEGLATIEKIERVIDTNTLNSIDSLEIKSGGIAETLIRVRGMLAVDDRSQHPVTGRFVLVDGRAMASCDLPLSFAVDKRITTIEGLGDAHPVQKALVRHQAAARGSPPCTRVLRPPTSPGRAPPLAERSSPGPAQRQRAGTARVVAW